MEAYVSPLRATRPNNMPVKKRWIILGVIGVALVIGYHIACSWAKDEITKRAHEVLGVQVNIEDVGIAFFSQSLFIEKIAVQQLPFLGNSLTIEEARIRPDFDVLLQKQLRVQELRVIQPRLSSQLTFPALPPIGDIKAIKDAIKKQSKKEKQITLPQPVKSLMVEDGTIEFSLTIGESKPNTLSLTKLFYQNHDLTNISPMSLLTDATYSFDVHGGHIEKAPGRFSATNIDLASLTKLLSPSETLQFSAGTLDLSWQDGSAKISLKQAKLSQKLSLLSFNGAFDLEFTIPVGKDSQDRADVRLIAAEFWVGFWTKLLEDASDELKKKLLREAIEAAKK
jgi:hypothetical protein